jgi:antitoxin ParD1/3/4
MVGSTFFKIGTVECWLRDELIPVYDAMQADLARGIPAEQVMASLCKRHAERLKTIDREA